MPIGPGGFINLNSPNQGLLNLFAQLQAQNRAAPRAAFGDVGQGLLTLSQALAGQRQREQQMQFQQGLQESGQQFRAEQGRLDRESAEKQAELNRAATFRKTALAEAGRLREAAAKLDPNDPRAVAMLQRAAILETVSEEGIGSIGPTMDPTALRDSIADRVNRIGGGGSEGAPVSMPPKTSIPTGFAIPGPLGALTGLSQMSAPREAKASAKADPFADLPPRPAGLPRLNDHQRRVFARKVMSDPAIAIALDPKQTREIPVRDSAHQVFLDMVNALKRGKGTLTRQDVLNAFLADLADDAAVLTMFPTMAEKFQKEPHRTILRGGTLGRGLFDMRFVEGGKVVPDEEMKRRFPGMSRLVSDQPRIPFIREGGRTPFAELTPAASIRAQPLAAPELFVEVLNAAADLLGVE